MLFYGLASVLHMLTKCLSISPLMWLPDIPMLRLNHAYNGVWSRDVFRAWCHHVMAPLSHFLHVDCFVVRSKTLKGLWVHFCEAVLCDCKLMLVTATLRIQEMVMEIGFFWVPAHYFMIAYWGKGDERETVKKKPEKWWRRNIAIVRKCYIFFEKFGSIFAERNSTLYMFVCMFY